MNVSMLVTMLSLLAIKNISRSEKRWKKLLPCLLLGIVLSWKINLFLIVPVFALIILRQRSFRIACWYTGIVMTSFLAVTLPYMLYDFAHFTPLNVSNKMAFYDFFSQIDKVVVGLSLLYALTTLTMRGDFVEVYLRKAMVVLIIPIIATFFLASLAQSGDDFLSLSFGMSYYYYFLIYIGRKIRDYDSSLLLRKDEEQGLGKTN